MISFNSIQIQFNTIPLFFRVIFVKLIRNSNNSLLASGLCSEFAQFSIINSNLRSDFEELSHFQLTLLLYFEKRYKMK